MQALPCNVVQRLNKSRQRNFKDESEVKGRKVLTKIKGVIWISRQILTCLHLIVGYKNLDAMVLPTSHQEALQVIGAVTPFFQKEKEFKGCVC